VGASRRRFRWPHAYAQLMLVRITSMEFPVMSRASGQARPGVHRFTGTAAGAMAHLFAAWSRVRRSKQPAAYARKVLLNRHPSRTPIPEWASPACEPCHRSWNRTLVPSSGDDLRPWWPTACGVLDELERGRLVQPIERSASPGCRSSRPSKVEMPLHAPARRLAGCGPGRWAGWPRANLEAALVHG
jgi:hypothetical protein